MRCAQLLLVFGIFLLLTTSVLAADIQTAEYAVIEGVLSNPIELLADGHSVSISYINALISWFPRDMQGQEVTSFTTNPVAKQTDDTLLFEIKNPSLGTYRFDVNYEIRTRAAIQEVDVLVPFPLPPFSSDLLPYLQATDTIDITNEMIAIASGIASKKDDAYMTIAAIAEWTKQNIVYDLSTIAVEASQPSSWVLENREGVCDEMTNLFISFVRSLGIPARFVSGLAYTESELFTKNWGAHGWAEVYFPGVGWIPFDIAYGQFGWVDASHIIFSTGVDSGKYASSYEWLGNDVKVRALGMELDANIISTSGKINPLLEIDVEVLEEEIGIGSYQLVQAEISNPTNQYVADVVSLGMVNDMEILDEQSQLVVLSPGTSTTVSWRILVADYLNKNAYYRYPVIVASHRGASDESSFTVRPRETQLSLSLVDSFIKARENGELPSSEKLLFVCKATNTYIPRTNEEIEIMCTLENTDQITLSNLNVCMEETNCKELVLAPKEEKTISFQTHFENASIYALSFSARNDKAEKHAYFSLEVIDAPLVSLENITAPTQLDYSSEGHIQFLLKQTKGIPLHDVVLRLDGPRVSNEWTFTTLEGEKAFDVLVSGSTLSLKENTFTLLLTGKDDRNQDVLVTEDFELKMGEITWWQRIILGFTELFIQ